MGKYCPKCQTSDERFCEHQSDLGGRLNDLMEKWEVDIEDWKKSRDETNDPMAASSFDTGARIMRVMLRELKETIAEGI